MLEAEAPRGTAGGGPLFLSWVLAEAGRSRQWMTKVEAISRFMTSFLLVDAWRTEGNAFMEDERWKKWVSSAIQAAFEKKCKEAAAKHRHP